MNKLLTRQIKKHLCTFSKGQLKEMQIFFKSIEDSYEGFENDRILMERSLDISSKELLGKNKILQDRAEIQEQVLENLQEAFKELVPNMKTGPNCKNKNEDCYEIVALTEYLKELIHERKISDKKIKKQSQEIQKKKEDLEKFKQATDCVEDQVMFTDTNGVVIYANKMVETTTGFSIKKEIIGNKAGSKKLWGSLMPPEFYSKLWKTIKEEKHSFVGEMKNKRKDGSTYIVEIRISPVLDKKKNILFFVGISRDITKAKEVDRLKSEFISIASHQLRTPLSSMRWLLEMLLDESMGKLTKQQKELIEQCFDSNQRMIDLVNDLLNVSRIEMGTLNLKPEIIDLKSITESLIKEIFPLAKTKLQNLDFQYPKNISPVLADKSYIRQTILNFISNAIKYTPDHGNICIKITEKPRKLLFEVTDNGLGIPKLEQSKIFTKFFRAENVSKTNIDGSGLGLYIVKSIIECSGGRVGFKSTEGVGTTFYFTLPKKLKI